jgi:hypothetical protein
MTSLLSTDDVTIPENKAPDPEKVTLDALVGEGKKYKDPDAIANAVVHKDNHIAQLERETARMREQIAELAAERRANERFDEIRDLLTNRTAETPNNDPTQERERVESAPIKEEDIEKILDKREAVRRKTDNIKTVKNKLVEVYGRDFTEKVKEAATNLNVGTDFLDSVAAQNPQAFYKLIGLEDEPAEPQRAPDGSPPPRNRLSPDVFRPVTGSQKNWDYYETMRRSDPVRYASRETQWEMDREAVKQGEAFYHK